MKNPKLALYENYSDKYELARGLHEMTLDVDRWEIDGERLVHDTGLWLQRTRSDFWPKPDHEHEDIAIYECSIGDMPSFALKMGVSFPNLWNALLRKNCQETIDHVRILAKLSA